MECLACQNNNVSSIYAPRADKYAFPTEHTLPDILSNLFIFAPFNKDM